MLGGLRESGGAAVSDRELINAGIQFARAEGVFAAPEGAACIAALRNLDFAPDERIVIYNTGSGLKYPEAYSTRFLRLHEANTTS
jgi:threonine synthase